MLPGWDGGQAAHFEHYIIGNRAEQGLKHAVGRSEAGSCSMAGWLELQEALKSALYSHKDKGESKGLWRGKLFLMHTTALCTLDSCLSFHPISLLLSQD